MVLLLIGAALLVLLLLAYFCAQACRGEQGAASAETAPLTPAESLPGMRGGGVSSVDSTWTSGVYVSSLYAPATMKSRSMPCESRWSRVRLR